MYYSRPIFGNINRGSIRGGRGEGGGACG